MLSRRCFGKMSVLSLGALALAIALMGLFGACNNPFTPGQGPRVTIGDARVFYIEPVTAGILSGTVEITGVARAHRQLPRIEVQIAGEGLGARAIGPEQWLPIDHPYLGGGITGYTFVPGADATAGYNARWSFFLDTLNFRGESIRDGRITMRFRAVDNIGPSEPEEVFYTVKNEPSTVRLSVPADGRRYLASGRDIRIRGTVIDIMGLAPGYPMIRIWRGNEEPFSEGDDPRDWPVGSGQAGWVSMFLDSPASQPPIVDSVPTYAWRLRGDEASHDPENPEDPIAVRFGTFTFELYEFGAGAERADGVVPATFPFGSVGLAPGLYNFRIITRDLAGTVGHYPPFVVDNTDPDNPILDPARPAENPANFNIIDNDDAPSISINNDDLRANPADPGSDWSLNPYLLPSRHVTGATSLFIAIDDEPGADARDDRELFRLRVRAFHHEGIGTARLRWEHPNTGRSGILGLVDEGGAYVPDPDGGAPIFSRANVNFAFSAGGPSCTGVYEYDGTVSARTDTQGHRYEPVLSGGSQVYRRHVRRPAREVFTSHSGQYELTFSASTTFLVAFDADGAPAGRSGERMFSVVMDREGPSVDIRPSIRGASGFVSGAAQSRHGGRVNENAITVNDNIQVSIDRGGNFGILRHSDDMLGIATLANSAAAGDAPPAPAHQMVKWFAEPLDGLWSGAGIDDPPQGSILYRLVQFRSDPNFDGHEFFRSLGSGSDGGRWGWVSPSGTPPPETFAHPAYGGNFFKFDASPFDGQDLWLYAIAMDGIGNLGFAMQKIHVDESLDVPGIELPALSQLNASEGEIAGPDDLKVTAVKRVDAAGDYIFDANGNPIFDLAFGTNWAEGSPRLNVLARNQGIEISLRDDDGIRREALVLDGDERVSGYIQITLTDLTAASQPFATLTTAHLLEALTVGSERERMGTLSQAIMAAAFNQGRQPGHHYFHSGNHLRDGFYRLDIRVYDSAYYKVLMPGETVGNAVPQSARATYFFAVHTALPEITVTSPANDTLQRELVTVRGTVRSRFPMRNLWITFAPDVLRDKVGEGPVSREIALVTTPANTADLETHHWGLAVAADGTRTYYWEKPDVELNPDPIVDSAGDPTDGAELRPFTLRAFNKIGHGSNMPHRVQVDAMAPTVTLFSFNQGRYPGTREVWGNVHFRVNVADLHGLHIEDTGGRQRLGVWWRLIPQEGELPQDITGAPPTPGLGGQFYFFPYAHVQPAAARHTDFNANLDAVFDSSLLTPNREYRLFVMARDAAENWYYSAPGRLMGGRVLAENIRLAPEADFPTLDVGVLFPETPLGAEHDSVLRPEHDGRLSIRGVARDADLFIEGFAGEYVEIRFLLGEDSSNEAGWSAWQPVPAILHPGGALRFALPFFEDDDFTDNVPAPLRRDGRVRYQIRVSDEDNVALHYDGSPRTRDPRNALDHRNKNPQLGIFYRFGIGSRDAPGATFYPHPALALAEPATRVFPNDAPGPDARDYFSFVFDNSPPRIGLVGGIPEVPPAFSDVPALLGALQGTIAEANLLTFSISVGLFEDGRERLIDLVEGLGLDRYDPGTVAVPDPENNGATISVPGFSWDLSDLVDPGLLDEIRELFGGLQQGHQNVMLVAEDRAGNIGRTSWNFVWDETAPTITFTNIAAVDESSGRAPTVITEPYIRGSFDDLIGFLFDSYGGELSFSYRFNASDGSGFPNSASVTHAAGQSLSSALWTINLGEMTPAVPCCDSSCADSGCHDCNCDDCDWAPPTFESLRAGIHEGENRLCIRVRDTAGNERTLTGMRFILDMSDPALADMGWDNVLGGIIAPPLTPTNHFLANWTADGADFRPMLDFQRVFSADAVAASSHDAVFYLRGRVHDANLRDLTARISSEGEDLVVARAWTPGNEPADAEDRRDREGAAASPDPDSRLLLSRNNEAGIELPAGYWMWTLRVSQRDVYRLSAQDGANDGTRRLVSLVATDRANRRSPTAQWPFYLDSAEPEVDFHSLRDEEDEGEPNIFRPGTALAGSASDGTGIRDVRFVIARWNYAHLRWDWFRTQAGAAGAWDGPASSGEGAFASGFCLSALPPEYVSENRAELAVPWRIDAGKFPPNLAPADNPFAPGAEGQFKVYVRAVDWSLARGAATAGNPSDPKGGENYRFFMDNGPPEIEWVRGYGRQFLNAERFAEGFEFMVRDGNTVPTVRAEIIRNADDERIWSTETNGGIGMDSAPNEPSATERLITLVMPSAAVAAAGMASGGTYTLVLAVEDAAGRENYMDNTLAFVFDSVSPVPEAATVITRPAQPAPPDGANSITLAGHVTIRGETLEGPRLSAAAPPPHASPVSRVQFALVGNPVPGSSMTPADFEGLSWEYNGYFQGTLGAGANPPAAELRAIRLEDNPGVSWTISIPNTRHITGNAAFAGRYAPRFAIDSGSQAGGAPPLLPGAAPSLFWDGEELEEGVVHFMRVAVRAEDAAGNHYFAHKDLWLYPEGDRPMLEIRTPDAGLNMEENPLSGRFTISGMAEDNEHVYAVFFRIREAIEYPANSGEFIAGSRIFDLHVPQFNAEGMPIAGTEQQPAEFTLASGEETAAADRWFRASGGGSRSAFWSAPVNDRGELNAPGARGMNRIIIEAVAVDATRASPVDPWVRGEHYMASEVAASQAIVVTGAPVFAPVTDAASGFRPADGTPRALEQVHLGRRSGNVSFSFQVRHESGISAIRYQRTNQTPTSYGAFSPEGSVMNLLELGERTIGGVLIPARTDIYRGVTVSATAPARAGGYYVSTVNVSLNIAGAENAIPQLDRFRLAHDAAFANNLRFPLFIGAADDSAPVPIAATNGDLWLTIDNTPPSARHEHNPSIAGSSAPLGGSAGDAGEVDRVVAWFQTRGTAAGADNSGVPWHWTGDLDTASAPAFQWGDNVEVSGSPGTIRLPFIPTGAAAATAQPTSFAVVIDRNDAMAGQIHHGHRVNMGWAVGGLGQLWNFTFDSHRLPSGPLTMHYVVFDRAGNATHFTQNIIVMNDAPIIGSVQLATDLRGRRTVGGAQHDVLGDVALDAVLGHSNVSTHTHAGIFSAIRTAFGHNADNDENNIRSGITPPRRPASQAGLLTQAGQDSLGARLNVENFTARNDFLGVGVQMLRPPGAGVSDRRFMVDFVHSVGPRIGVDAIVAGGVYVIDTPSDVDWRMLGTQTRVAGGYAFLAVSSGSAVPASDGRSLAFVRQLNPSNPLMTDANRPRVNMPVHHWGSGSGSEGGHSTAVSNTRAEFAFRHEAFGAGRITDYAHGPTAGAWLYRLEQYRLFIVRVFDGPTTNHFADFTLLEVRVNNDDQTQPFAQLHDLNPAAEELDFTGEDIPAGIAPDAVADSLHGQIADNRARGGLWRSEFGGNLSRPGNIEPRRIDLGANAPVGPYTRYFHSLSPAEMDPHQDPRTTVNPNAFFEEDTVSGRVVLRGYVEDDQRIGRVDLVFDSVPAGITQTVAILESAEWANDPDRPAYQTGLLSVPESGVAQGNVFFADTIDLYRHRVEWAFVWDTAQVPDNFVVGNLNVQVRAYNAENLASRRMNWGDRVATSANRMEIGVPTPAQGGSGIGNPSVRNPGFPVNLYRYNSIDMHVRPYITGFRRDDSEGFHSRRTLQGRYAFHRGENVVVTGFNLGSAADGVITQIIMNTRAAAGTGTEGNITAAVGRTTLPNTTVLTATQGGNFAVAAGRARDADRARHFAIPANAVTGDNLAVAVGGLAGTDINSFHGGVVELRVTRGGQAWGAVNTDARATTVAARGGRQRNVEIPANMTVAPRMVNNGWWTQPWNTEWSAGAEGSDLWDNVTAIHVWQSDNAGIGASPGIPAGAGAAVDRGGFAASQAAAAGSNPWVVYGASMSIDPRDGTLLSSHNESGGGEGGVGGTGTNAWTRISRNASPDGASNNDAGWHPTSGTSIGGGIHSGGRVTAFIDPIVHSSIFVNPTGEAWVASSILDRASNHQPWDALGGVFVHGPGGNRWIPRYPGLNANTSLYPVQSTWYQGSWQNTNLTAGRPTGVTASAANNWLAGQTSPVASNLRNPRVITSVVGGVEHIHVAYFCSLTGSIRYRYNRRGQVTATGAASAGGIGGANPDLTPWGLGGINNANPVAAGVNSPENVRRLWTNLDGGVAPDDVAAARGAIGTTWYSGTLAGTGAGGLNVGGTLSPLVGRRVVDHGRADIATARSNNAGEHNDIAVTSNGNPVIVYFCAQSQVLRIAVSSVNNENAVAGSSWRIFEVFSGAGAGSPRAHGTGHYVSMRIDTVAGTTQNRVHISAFNADTNNLVYIQGTIVNNAWVFGHSVVVDSVGRSVGRRSAISLDRHGNPWISYFDQALVGGMDAVKVAFHNPAVFGTRAAGNRLLEDVYGRDGACGDLTGWETMHVPAQFPVVDVNHALWGSRLGMENFPTRNVLPAAATAARFWSAAVGFLSSDRFRIAYWVE